MQGTEDTPRFRVVQEFVIPASEAEKFLILLAEAVKAVSGAMLGGLTTEWRQFEGTGAQND